MSLKIVVSNDDGYLAKGINVLAARLAGRAELFVIAPDRDRSGASNSLTLDRPLRVNTSEQGVRYVNGTPTDCVHLAITGLLADEPDMVVSGINAGANLGDDVIYSGTVAAAMEGRFLGLPAIAVSLVGTELRNYETAARVADKLVAALQESPVAGDTVLNVNVPDVPWEELQGFEVTRLGQRHKAEPVIKDKDPRGRDIYWIGPAGAEQDAGPGTDFYAIRENKVSITPLYADLTQYEKLDELRNWATGVSW